MRNELPGISKEAYSARWKLAYRTIRQGWNAEAAGWVEDWRRRAISRQECLTRIGNSIAMIDTLLAEVRAYRSPYALLLLENFANLYRSETIGDYSLFDNTNAIGSGILRYMNVQIMEVEWLSDLLVEHSGIFHTKNDIELSEMPPNCYYFYCDHPDKAGQNLPVQLGLCQVFSTLQELMHALNFQTADGLHALTGETLLPLYSTGVVSMNTYLTDDEWPCNLVFQQADGRTHITDQETDAEFILDAVLEDPGEFIVFTQQYAAGRPPANIHRLNLRG